MRGPTLVGLLFVVGALLIFSATQNVDVRATQVTLAAPTVTRDMVVPSAVSSSAAEHGADDSRPTVAVSAHAMPTLSSVSAAAQSAVSRSATPPPPVHAARPYKPCATGCERLGVCNTELGRCDCPPFIGGDACDKPLLPACAAAIGLKELAPAQCVYETVGNPSTPVSCECLMGCEALGLMGRRECYVIDPKNATVTAWVQKQIHVRGLTPNHEYWSAALKDAEAESVQKCKGRGVFAARMPQSGSPPSTAPKRCQCYPGWDGVSCERSTDRLPQRACLNSCSGRGKCVRNWCHCVPGAHGIDCSLGKPVDGAAATPLPPPIGAQGAGAPRLYIYELPPRYNSWMHAGEGGWWQDMDLWGEDVIIHRRALRSVYRTSDPEEADFFLVPVWVSSAMWQMNWGFRDLLPTGVRTVRELTAHLRKQWPYFDRRGGRDHLWVFGHDQGAWRIRQKLPEIGEGIFLSPFGGGPAQRGGHKAGQDLVVPSVVQNTIAGLMNHAGRRKIQPPNLAFFQGKLNLHIPYEYSFGIRQGLYKAHRNTPRIVIKEGHEANRETYFRNMCGSKFCVAAAGFGFSTRAYEAAAAGCLPLIMQDGIEQAYEELLPWPLFSMRLNNSLAQIANLAATLDKIPEETVRKKRSKLFCVWPRFLWLRHDPGAALPLPGADRLLKFDAFESIMWTLRKRLRADIGWPPDWDEACHEVQRYFAQPPSNSFGQWAPWHNYEFEQPAAAPA